MKIIEIIEKEKREEEAIISAIEARAERLENMTDAEKEMISVLDDQAAKAWDFATEE